MDKGQEGLGSPKVSIRISITSLFADVSDLVQYFCQASFEPFILDMRNAVCIGTIVKMIPWCI